MLLYWCEDFNVPVLDPREAAGNCAKISATPITEPSDPRPAFDVDKEIVQEAIANEEGDWALASLLVPRDEVVLLNKIPGYADQADEVIVRGRVIGHRFYDILERRWRFRPLYEGAAEILTQRKGWWAILDLDTLPVNYDVHEEKILEGSLPEKKYTHVVVSTRDGRIHGVAKLFRGRRLHIIKSWRAKPRLPPGVPSDLKTFAELNRAYIERKAERAVEFLKRAFSQYKLPVVVSYSGGKDSLVALDLVKRTGHPFYLLFNDTGLEAPETYENVKLVAQRYGAELIWASAGDSFWRAVKEFGPPARDYRWCCKVLKMAPITKAYLERFPQGVVTVVGQRAAESFQRARQKPISSSKWVAKTIVVAPLHEWSALDVWAYIVLHGLPYNKAYEYGFDRLGCLICPANEMAELEQVRRRYPEIYRRLAEEVVGFYGEQSYEEYGIWRWKRGVPGDVARFLKIKAEGRYPVIVRRRDDKVEIEGGRPDVPTALELLKMMGNVNVGSNGVEVSGGKLRATISPDFRTIEGDGALHAAALVVRAQICGHCDLCISWCPTKALSRGPDGRFRVDKERCIGCLICSKACPSAQYLVYRTNEEMNLK